MDNIEKLLTLQQPVRKHSASQLRHNRIRINASGESIKLLASVVVSGIRQFWVGGDFIAIKILEIPATDVVMDAFVTNTGINDTDWIAGIKARTPSANPEVVKIYTVFGDGRSTQIYSGVEARYLKYVGDGFWTSEPLQPAYDVYSQAIPSDPPLSVQLWDFIWRAGAQNGSAFFNFYATTQSLPITTYPSPVLSFSYTTQFSTTGFLADPASFSFTGTNSRDKTITSVASYSDFWQPFYSDYGANNYPYYPVTAPVFTSRLTHSALITQTTQYPSWNFYQNALTMNAGGTDVSVVVGFKQDVDVPSFTWNNPSVFTGTNTEVTASGIYNGYANKSPGRVEEIINSNKGKKYYSGQLSISPTRSIDYFEKYDVDTKTTQTITDGSPTNQGTVPRQTGAPVTVDASKNWVDSLELSHFFGDVSVGVRRTWDTRTNANALSNYNRTVYYGTTELIADLNGTLDPSWEYAFGYYHAAQWINQSKYFWIEMPADMGTGIDDARHWDEVEFPDHADFATGVLNSGRSWSAIEYAPNASNAYLPVGSASAISSLGFGLGGYTEPRIYDARYVRS